METKKVSPVDDNELYEYLLVANPDKEVNEKVMAEIAAFFREQGVSSVGMIDSIIGCPHEEGIDYPDGEVCPKCLFWARRDRWSGLPKVH